MLLGMAQPSYGRALLLGHDVALLPPEVKARIAASSLLVPNGGLLVHRSVFDRVGWYDASIVLRRSCDWDLFRRIVDGGVEFGILSDVLMREYGDLQPDSLRNSFTTTFDMMARFVQGRDSAWFHPP